MTLPKAEDILNKHAGDCLTVNGLGSRQFTDAMKEYSRQVLDYAAENSKAFLVAQPKDPANPIPVVDKQSILKIKDEL